jgi:DNA-binding transcriptional ArsR family regulator
MPKPLPKQSPTAQQREAESRFKALANARRLQILDWLRDPVAHFPTQVDGDLVQDGVCGLFVAQKLGISQPTAHQHLKILVDAGYLVPTRIKQWTFYRRDDRAIAAMARLTEGV